MQKKAEKRTKVWKKEENNVTESVKLVTNQ